MRIQRNNGLGISFPEWHCVSNVDCCGQFGGGETGFELI